MHNIWTQPHGDVLKRLERIYDRFSTSSPEEKAYSPEKIARIKKKILNILLASAQGNPDAAQSVMDRVMRSTKLIHFFSQLAYYSPLTWLLNRVGLASKVSQEYDSEALTSAIVFDIDYLKTYNTDHGHDGGDIAIKHVGKLANKIVKQYRDQNPDKQIDIAHLSWDEFVIIVTGDKLYAREIAESIHAELKIALVDIYSVEYNVSITCGIATTNHVREFDPQVKQKWERIEIPLWFAKVMRLADDAVTLSERGSTFICDGTVPMNDLTKSTKNFVSSLSDMLRAIQNNTTLMETLPWIIAKIAQFQDTKENINSIQIILSGMQNNIAIEISERDRRYITKMLEMIEKFRNSLGS